MSRPDVEDLPLLLHDRSETAVERLSEFYAPLVTALAEEIVAEARQHEMRQHSASLTSLLAKFIGQVPDRQKIILTLLYYERLSPAEVAHVLGVKPATIRSHQRQALQTLRNELVHSGLFDRDRATDLFQDTGPTGEQRTQRVSADRVLDGPSFSELREHRRSAFAAAGLLMETHPTLSPPPSRNKLRVAKREAGRGKPLADFVSEGRD
ncbi:MAG: RNA polymerase sigma factor [Acidimicrobiales bacterium]